MDRVGRGFPAFEEQRSIVVRGGFHDSFLGKPRGKKMIQTVRTVGGGIFLPVAGID
jgi:hypothetical protein